MVLQMTTLRLRPSSSRFARSLQGTSKVFGKLRFLQRRNHVVCAIPARPFQSEISRVLDNVDEITQKKPKSDRKRTPRNRGPPRKDSEDWTESTRTPSPEEWGTDPTEDLTEDPADLEEDESVRNDGYSYYKASSISVLTDQEKESVLPLIPAGQQAGFYTPSEIPTKLAWWGSALCGCVLFSSNAWLAGLFLTSPLLVPWCLAGLRNWELQSKGTSSVGIWHCQVLNIDVLENASKDSSSQNLIRLLIGDPWKGGVRVEMVVPQPERVQPPSVGELCDLLVLTNQQDFALFKVVREAYFPRTRLWLAEYPFIDREAFYRIICAIQEQQNEVQLEQDNW